MLEIKDLLLHIETECEYFQCKNCKLKHFQPKIEKGNLIKAITTDTDSELNIINSQKKKFKKHFNMLKSLNETLVPNKNTLLIDNSNEIISLIQMNDSLKMEEKSSSAGKIAF